MLEMLLVVGGIAILSSIVIVAINPPKQLGETRNAQRRVDINTILNATYQYAIDAGYLPSTIVTSTLCATSSHEICKTDATCGGYIDLNVLTQSEKYLTKMPFDPTGSTNNGTGYFISKSDNGRVTVCAPSAEQGATISVTR